jgi:hypothetical protein
MPLRVAGMLLVSLLLKRCMCLHTRTQRTSRQAAGPWSQGTPPTLTFPHHSDDRRTSEVPSMHHRPHTSAVSCPRSDGMSPERLFVDILKTLCKRRECSIHYHAATQRHREQTPYVRAVRTPMLGGRMPSRLRESISSRTLQQRQRYECTPIDPPTADATTTHITRFLNSDPVPAAHVTPSHASSHGSLPVAWSSQPVLPLVHESPFVARYRSTSAVRCAATVANGGGHGSCWPDTSMSLRTSSRHTH